MIKKTFVSFLSLNLLLASCTSPTPTPDPDLLNGPWDDRTIFKSGLVASEQSVLNELEGASIYHIEFTIEGNLHQITGTEEVHYTNTEDGALQEVHFRLFPNILGGELKISNLAVNGQAAVPTYGLENSLLIVPLSSALEPGQHVDIKMNYALEVPQKMEAGYGALAYSDGVLALAHAYPLICVHDDEGWNAEIPSHNGDITYADAAFYLVRIRAPKDLTLVTSGREVSRGNDGQMQVLTVANGPARDFYLAASPNYQEISKSFGEVTIRSFAEGKSMAGARLALDVAARAIDIFGRRYAPYPYTEFDIVATPHLALGIEYPGMTAITTRLYDVDGEFRGSPTSVYMESVVAHEVGHQWFYNLVGDDQLDEPWLDEALSQFATLQYYSDKYGSSGAAGFQSYLEESWGSVSNGDIPIGLPAASYSETEYTPIVYNRGALFFVALRDEMGVEAFDAFLRDYSGSISWGIATPDDLQSQAEKHCSCNLDAIFEEWVYP